MLQVVGMGTKDSRSARCWRSPSSFHGTTRPSSEGEGSLGYKAEQQSSERLCGPEIGQNAKQRPALRCVFWTQTPYNLAMDVQYKQ